MKTFKLILFIFFCASALNAQNSDSKLKNSIMYQQNSTNTNKHNARAFANPAKTSLQKGLKAYENKDFKTALVEFEKACNGGFASGCFAAGAIYSEGQGVKQDYTKANEFNTKACDGGNEKACFYLGNSYRDARGVKQDYVKANELYTKACDGGFKDGCLNLGYSYANARGVKQDYAKANEIFSKARDGGEEKEGL